MPNYPNNNNRRYNPRPAPQLPPEVSALPLPADYVDAAERVIQSLIKDAKAESERKKRKVSIITTNKIRNLMSRISNIYNVENLRTEADLHPESKTSLDMARIRMVYEAGRDEPTRKFLKEAKLLEYIKGIGTDREKLIAFAHYMEALVAYHRFLTDGKEG